MDLVISKIFQYFYVCVDFYNFFKTKEFFPLLHDVKIPWKKKEFRLVRREALNLKMRASRLSYDFFSTVQSIENFSFKLIIVHNWLYENNL